MEKIQLHSVLPQVFAQRNDLDSEIWKQDVTFEKGHLYLIEAESGSGKSTFCSANYKVKDWVEMRKRHISHLFQELRLFPELTALENVEIKNKIIGFKTREQILKWFEMLGIADKVDAKIGRMSFGQQQRVAMMRALCQPFDFILADEPISHLDDNNSRIMADIMMTEAKEQGAGVIVTSIGKHMGLPYEHVFKL